MWAALGNLSAETCCYFTSLQVWPVWEDSLMTREEGKQQPHKSLIGKNPSRSWVLTPSVLKKIPAKFLRPSTGRLYKLTCPYASTTVPRSFAPFTTLTVYEASASCSSFTSCAHSINKGALAKQAPVAARLPVTTHPLSCQKPTRQEACLSQSGSSGRFTDHPQPWWHQPPSQSHQAPHGRS